MFLSLGYACESILRWNVIIPSIYFQVESKKKEGMEEEKKEGREGERKEKEGRREWERERQQRLAPDRVMGSKSIPRKKTNWIQTHCFKLGAELRLLPVLLTFPRWKRLKNKKQSTVIYHHLELQISPDWGPTEAGCGRGECPRANTVGLLWGWCYSHNQKDWSPPLLRPDSGPGLLEAILNP